MARPDFEVRHDVIVALGRDKVEAEDALDRLYEGVVDALVPNDALGALLRLAYDQGVEDGAAAVAARATRALVGEVHVVNLGVVLGAAEQVTVVDGTVDRLDL